jgi:hypothetical protein
MATNRISPRPPSTATTARARVDELERRARLGVQEEQRIHPGRDALFKTIREVAGSPAPELAMGLLPVGLALKAGRAAVRGGRAIKSAVDTSRAARTATAARAEERAAQVWGRERQGARLGNMTEAELAAVRRAATNKRIGNVEREAARGQAPRGTAFKRSLPKAYDMGRGEIRIHQEQLRLDALEAARVRGGGK